MKNYFQQKNWIIIKTEIAILFLISSIFVVLQIQNSLANGVLALYFTWDDVWYFKDALIRVGDLYNGQFLKNYIAFPPHAPLATFLCMIGILLFGVVNWAPALVAGLFVFALVLFVHYLTRNLPALFRYCAIVLVFGWPITTHIFIELRPDVICGFLTIVTIFLILEQEQWYYNAKQSFVIGLVLSFALLAKPSISPLTITSTGLAILVALIRDYKIFHLNIFVNKIKLLKPVTFFIIPIIILSLPHYILAFDHIISYIYSAIIKEKRIWDLNLTIAEEAKYYIWGYGGKFMMGKWRNIFWVITILSTLIWWLKSKNRKIDFFSFVSFIVVFFYIYLAATIPSAKSTFLGVVVPWFILLGNVKIYNYILIQLIENKNFNEKLKLKYLVVALTIIVFYDTVNWSVYQRSGMFGLYDVKKNTDILFQRERMDYIVSTLLDYRGKGPITENSKVKVFIGSSDSFLNGDQITIELYKHERVMGDRALDFDISEISLSDDWNLFKQRIDSADIIIAFSTDDPQPLKLQTIGDRRADVLKYICQNKDLMLKKILVKTIGSGTNYIFLRKNQTSGPYINKKEVCDEFLFTKTNN